MSLLTLIQGACAEIGLQQPASVIGASDVTTAKMLQLAQKEGKELARRFDWQILHAEANFTTVDDATQLSSITSSYTDFGRYVRESMWNRTTGWPIQGPLDELEWQQRMAAGTMAGMGNWFRFRGGSILFYPTPEAGDSVYFEYIKKTWCQSAGDVAQTAWMADTDTSILDEELMRLGVVWRFMQNNGLDYGEAFMAYERALADAIGGEPKAVLDMTGVMSNYLTLTIPEGNWNV